MSLINFHHADRSGITTIVRDIINHGHKAHPTLKPKA